MKEKMKENKQKNQLWFTFATLFVALLWAGIPFFQSGAASEEYQNDNITTFLHAPLSGHVINGVTPTGNAGYKVFSDNSRSLEVIVNSVNVPAGTVLNVFVNNTQAGQLTISMHRSGRLELRTSHGHTVPMAAVGNTVTLRQGATTILSGTFAAVPTPSPTPTGTPNWGTSLYAQLTGAPINNTVPRGFAEYRSSTIGSRLRVFVGSIHLPQNTTLTVFVDNTNVGNFNLSNGRGNFESTSSSLPTITTETVLSVRNGEATILSGTFASNFPTPSPSPSPSGSPTPHPTPGPARFFQTRLRGSSVVPPVTTQARGSSKILINADGTEIRVFAGFFGLSSDQTTATINGPAQPNANGEVIFNLGVIGGTSGFLPVQTFAVTGEQVAQLRAGLWYIVIGSVNNPTGEIRGQFRAHGQRGDYEGDGRTDLSVFRPTDGKWYFLNSSDNQFRSQTLGGAGDKVVSGDFDGDGVVDAAVFRNENGSGVWSIRRSYDGAVINEQWGFSSDIPIVADFDGDGRADLAVFRPATGHWYIKNSSDGSLFAIQWGQSGDVPLAADFDGDGRADITVFRPSNGVWYQFRSGDNSFYGAHWGMSGDIPIVGDFDGDGRADITVWRPGNGAWYTLRSIDNQFSARQFGGAGDIPITGVFDSDGLTDIAVFRPSTGIWYQWRSVEGFIAIPFGMNGDIPAITNP